MTTMKDAQLRFTSSSKTGVRAAPEGEPPESLLRVKVPRTVAQLQLN